MVYTKLNDDREEIRLLRFEQTLALYSSCEILRLSLEKVSLKDLSDDFSSHANGGEPYADWNDAFFPHIEYRRALLNGQDSALQHVQHVPLQVQSSTRFVWGDYEALSYTWGDGTQKAHVQINGVLKQVSSALEAALRMLQRLPETRFGMRYWIDALCIRQDDIKERNVQVKRMKKIYSTARSVVVWLGPTSPDDEIALRVMNAIYRDDTRNGWLMIPLEFGADHWRALCAFMGKSYWSRLWIIQELAANQRSTLFSCGAHELNRETLKLAVYGCQKLYREEAPFIHHQANIWETSTRLLRLIDLTSTMPKDAMLRKALSLSRQAMVSKEKDKVYGILALLDDTISSEINPDYSNATTIQDVFTVLTVAIIKATKRVEQIVYSSIYNLEWPSWVPDLRRPFVRHHMQYLRQCKASRNTSAKFSFSQQSDPPKMHLRVKGIKVDYVDGISASPGLDELPVFPQYHNRRYNYNLNEVLGKTLVVGHPKIHGSPVFMKLPWRPKDKSVQSNLWDSQQYLDFDEFRSVNQDFIINCQSLRSCFPEDSSRLPTDSIVRHHLRLAAVTSKGRKLVTTETGYLGLVPDCVQREDVLVVLLGCNFPVLLRHYKEGYHVLGECYVHGLMAGEVFAAQKREHLPYQNFTLL